MIERRWWWIAVAAVCLGGLVLRLYGLHAPLLDHPGWRQGDMAAVARNFATIRYNIFFPQVEYNGPAPNYVELELQIIPFLAATLYKIFGVHEVFGRLIAIAFGVATIAVTGAFARWLFGSFVAGVGAMVLYAIFPGSIYYARSFQPDTAMVFFLTLALYAVTRWMVNDDTRSWRSMWPAALALLFAFLAKQVALVALVPLAALAVTRFGVRGIAVRWTQLAALLAIALVPLVAYESYVSAHAEWHWASGIMKLHVIPSLLAALTSGSGFIVKARAFFHAFRMLGTTMLGPIGLAILVAGFCVRLRSRADAVLYGWLAGVLVYAYVVVTVERVDYYLYPFLPLAAIIGGRLCMLVAERIPETRRSIAIAGALVVALGMTYVDRRLIAPYYAWSRNVYTRSLALNRTLAPGTLIVMGHYDPSLMYYIGHKGWMEDPYIWTPFDEQSAIRKGARYFIAVEPKRLARNVELSHWLARFPLLDEHAKWPVYQTDYAKMLPGAEARWQTFRRLEKARDPRALTTPL